MRGAYPLFNGLRATLIWFAQGFLEEPQSPACHCCASERVQAAHGGPVFINRAQSLGVSPWRKEFADALAGIFRAETQERNGERVRLRKSEGIEQVGNGGKSEYPFERLMHNLDCAAVNEVVRCPAGSLSEVDDIIRAEYDSILTAALSTCLAVEPEGIS